MILFLHEILKFGVTELDVRRLNRVESCCNLPYAEDSSMVLAVPALPGVYLSFPIAEEHKKSHLYPDVFFLYSFDMNPQWHTSKQLETLTIE